MAWQPRIQTSDHNFLFSFWIVLTNTIIVDIDRQVYISLEPNIVGIKIANTGHFELADFNLWYSELCLSQIIW